jgi:hypothetical protein
LQDALFAAWLAGGLQLEGGWSPLTSNMMDWLSVTIYVSRTQSTDLEAFLHQENINTSAPEAFYEETRTTAPAKRFVNAMLTANNPTFDLTGCSPNRPSAASAVTRVLPRPLSVCLPDTARETKRKQSFYQSTWGDSSSDDSTDGSDFENADQPWMFGLPDRPSADEHGATGSGPRISRAQRDDLSPSPPAYCSPPSWRIDAIVEQSGSDDSSNGSDNEDYGGGDQRLKYFEATATPTPLVPLPTMANADGSSLQNAFPETESAMNFLVTKFFLRLEKAAEVVHETMELFCDQDTRLGNRWPGQPGAEYIFEPGDLPPPVVQRQQCGPSVPSNIGGAPENNESDPPPPLPTPRIIEDFTSESDEPPLRPPKRALSPTRGDSDGGDLKATGRLQRKRQLSQNRALSVDVDAFVYDDAAGKAPPRPAKRVGAIAPSEQDEPPPLPAKRNSGALLVDVALKHYVRLQGLLEVGLSKDDILGSDDATVWDRDAKNAVWPYDKETRALKHWFNKRLHQLRASDSLAFINLLDDPLTRGQEPSEPTELNRAVPAHFNVQAAAVVASDRRSVRRAKDLRQARRLKAQTAKKIRTWIEEQIITTSMDSKAAPQVILFFLQYPL